MLYDDFRKEKMQALKEKDKLKNKVITNILSDLIYIKKELGQEPTEADSAKAVAKQVKQVKEAIEMSKDRPDKLEELEAEDDDEDWDDDWDEDDEEGVEFIYKH